MKSDIYSHVVSCIKSGSCETGTYNEIRVRCPGCGDDEHFSINSKTGLYNCFKCSVSGGLKPEINKHLIEWKKLTKITSQRAPTFVRKGLPFYALGENTLSDILQGDMSDGKRSLRERHQARRALMYCLGRGMTKKQVYEYKVFIKPFDSRVYFPYWNEAGKIAFTMGRAINDEVEPKTLESDTSIKPLFGRHLQIHRNDVFLLEGVFDHFVTPASYAVMGSTVVHQQIMQLRQDNIKRIFLLFDPEAGEETKSTTARLAKAHFNVYPLILSGKKDPAKIGRRLMIEIVNNVIHRCPTRPQMLYINPS